MIGRIVHFRKETLNKTFLPNWIQQSTTTRLQRLTQLRFNQMHVYTSIELIFSDLGQMLSNSAITAFPQMAIKNYSLLCIPQNYKDFQFSVILTSKPYSAKTLIQKLKTRKLLKEWRQWKEIFHQVRLPSNFPVVRFSARRQQTKGRNTAREGCHGS